MEHGGSSNWPDKDNKDNKGNDLYKELLLVKLLANAILQTR